MNFFLWGYLLNISLLEFKKSTSQVKQNLYTLCPLNQAKSSSPVLYFGGDNRCDDDNDNDDNDDNDDHNEDNYLILLCIL